MNNNKNCYEYAFNMPIGSKIPKCIKELNALGYIVVNNIQPNCIILLCNGTYEMPTTSRHFVLCHNNKLSQKCGSGGPLEYSESLDNFEHNYKLWYNNIIYLVKA